MRAHTHCVVMNFWTTFIDIFQLPTGSTFAFSAKKSDLAPLTKCTFVSHKMRLYIVKKVMHLKVTRKVRDRSRRD